MENGSMLAAKTFPNTDKIPLCTLYTGQTPRINSVKTLKETDTINNHTTYRQCNSSPSVSAMNATDDVNNVLFPLSLQFFKSIRERTYKLRVKVQDRL